MIYLNKKPNRALGDCAYVALMLGGLAMGGYYGWKILRENCFCRLGGSGAKGAEKTSDTDCDCGCRMPPEGDEVSDDENTAVNCEGRMMDCPHKKESSKEKK